jgi:phosphinothricin acetyltransferase
MARSSTIRLARPADGPALAAIYRPAVEGITSFEAVAPDGAAMASRVAATLARMPWLVCEIGGEAAGYAYAGRHRERDAYRWTAEVSAYVHATHQRQRVGRALYTSLAAVLDLQHFATLVAGIALPNPASVAFHQSMGFTPIGVFRAVGFKRGRWVDVAWFERHLATPTVPEEPVSLPALDRAWLSSALATGLTELRR